MAQKDNVLEMLYLAFLLVEAAFALALIFQHFFSATEL